ncbi:ketopantoate reductase [Rhizobiales bacterium GAS188]|nr:ketopantoate reductase [Rhizobiales bacterium GAS188]
MSSSSSSQPRIAIIGSGAIGGFLAARLALAGRDPTLCVRSPVEELILESGGETHRVPVAIATDPSTEGPAEFVLLTTKAQDTAGAEPWLSALCRAGTTLVVVQNGIDHEARVAPYAAGAKILPALAYAGAERVAPGHVRHHTGSSLVVPKGEAGAALASLFAGSGVGIEQDEDFLTASWTKLLGNLAANPVTALTMRRMEVFGDPGTRALALSLLEEAVAVGRASGARLAEDQAQRTLAVLLGYNPAGGSSMLYDRLAGRPLEHEYLTGAVVRAAQRHGIDVPANRTVLALVAALSDGLAGARRSP